MAKKQQLLVDDSAASADTDIAVVKGAGSEQPDVAILPVRKGSNEPPSNGMNEIQPDASTTLKTSPSHQYWYGVAALWMANAAHSYSISSVFSYSGFLVVVSFHHMPAGSLTRQLDNDHCPPSGLGVGRGQGSCGLCRWYTCGECQWTTPATYLAAAACTISSALLCRQCSPLGG